jgi:hypothetical protein
LWSSGEIDEEALDAPQEQAGCISHLLLVQQAQRLLTSWQVAYSPSQHLQSMFKLVEQGRRW